MPISILIADDHGVLRAGLRALLNAEPDFQVVAEASSGEEAVHKAQTLQPQVVLMDIKMQGMDGIEATRQIVKTFPQVCVLLLTLYEETSMLREAMKAGATGYILKRAVETELNQAIRMVARGELYVHPEMTRALLTETLPEIQKSPEVTLTARELDVLKLIVHGYTNRQVADELKLSVRTVETHRANLMTKLNTKSRIDLVHYATDHGLL